MSAQPIHNSLLQFCLSHTDSASFDASQLPPRDPADYEWLQSVLSGLETPTQVVDRLSGELSDALGAESADEKRIASLLDALADEAEDIDSAQRVAAHSAAQVVPLVTHTSPLVRRAAAALIATVSMNNRSASLALLEQGALGHVLRQAAVEPVEAARSKLVTALSALLNDAEPPRTLFFSSGGARVLRALFVASVEATTRAKVLFLAAKLCRLSGAVARDAFVAAENHWFEPLVAALTESDMTLRTNAARLCTQLLESDDDSVIARFADAHFADVARRTIAELDELSGSDAAAHDDASQLVASALAKFEARLKK